MASKLPVYSNPRKKLSARSLLDKLFLFLRHTSRNFVLVI